MLPQWTSAIHTCHYLDGPLLFFLCRKRQAAAQLIQNYYKQLTDGCGNSDCDNPSCASCPDFSYKSTGRNELALQAITLSRQRARLCDGIPQKYAKLPVQETGNPQAVSSSSEGASTSTTGASPSCSRASGSGGAKAKQSQSHTVTSASSSNSSLGSRTGRLCLSGLSESAALPFPFTSFTP